MAEYKEILVVVYTDMEFAEDDMLSICRKVQNEIMRAFPGVPAHVEIMASSTHKVAADYLSNGERNEEKSEEVEHFLECLTWSEIF